MKNQWQIYKELELIADAIPAPQTNPSFLSSWLIHLRRSRSDASPENLSPQQQVGFLEQCWTLDGSEVSATSDIWQKIWKFLHQPLPLPKFRPTRSEPQIQKTIDPTGQAWWYVFDPLTGQAAYLESEDEVLVWLEERLYH